jgi:hypothetical protein
MRTRQRTDAVSTSSRALLLAPALLLSIVAASSHAASDGAGSSADSRITVTDVGGDVDVTMAGNAEAVSPHSTVLLPARIVTGHDGTLGLTQAGTNIRLSNDTDVEIPAEAVDGNLVARLVQHSGNVFYDVAPRDVGKLRVETPFLVAVIKGTQFNVAVQENGTTISLFEGHLEIRTPDDSDVVDLNAGEIAIRSLIDDSIRVIGMDDLRVTIPPPPAARAAGTDADAASTAALEVGATAADEAVALRVNDAAVGADTFVAVTPPKESTVVETPVLTGIETAVDLPIDIDTENSGLGVGRDRENPGVGNGNGNGGGNAPGHGGGRVEIPVDVQLDTHLDIELDLGTAADTGANLTVDSGQIDLTVDLADGGLDLGVNVDPPGHVELELDVGRGRAPGRRPRGLLGALP